jgi:hypothetical protein
MTDNISLELSLSFKKQLEGNLLPIFENLLPISSMDNYVKAHLSHTRDKVYTPVRTAIAMIFTGVQEDKSLQNTVNIFNAKYEIECKILQEKERALIYQSQQASLQQGKKIGRPRIYKSKIPKSKTVELSDSTVSYTKARKRLPLEFLQLILE